MTGTIINVIAIIIGSSLGTVLGGRMPERLRQTVMSGLGLFVLAMGLQMFLATKNSLVVLGSLVIGIILGEWLQVEEGIRWLGSWLEQRLVRQNGTDTLETFTLRRERFVRGFFTASLLFCIGPVAILGSIQDGMNGNYQLLVVKAILDGFASLAFASSLGIGVLFSILPLLVYQGGISLAATQLNRIMSLPMTNEMSATGGVLLMAIAISSLLGLKDIRSGNLLPALIIAPLIVALLTAIGINWAALP